MADTAATNPNITTTQTSTTPTNPSDLVARDLANAALKAALVPPVVSMDVSASYNTSTTASQVGLGFGSTQSTFNTNLGEKVVDTSLLTTIQSRNVYFSAYHLKPLTTLYAFFDNVNVTDYVESAYRIVLNKVVHTNRTKTFSRSNSNVEVLFAKGTTIYVNQTPIVSTSANGYLATSDTFVWDGITYTVVSASKSTTLTTDENGYIAGTFMIPAKTFNTGTRPFLLCDSSTNNGVEISTSAEFMYYASGMAVSKQSQTLSTRINQVTINPMLKSTTTEKAGTSTSPQATSAVNPVTITVDQTPPTITTYSPTKGATGVAVGSNIVFTFSETVTVNTGSVVVTKQNGTLIPSTATLSGGNTLTIDPSMDLEPSTVYLVTIPNGYVKDTSNNLFAGLFNYQFTTAVPVVVPKPSFTSTVPSAPVVEGNPVVMTLSIKDVSIGTPIYYSILPTTSTLNSLDFTTGDPFTGSFTVDSTMSKTLTFNTNVDGITEGTEIFTVMFYDSLGIATLLHTTASISIIDASGSLPTYKIVADKTDFTEGDTITFTVTTTNVANGPLYYNLAGDNITDADFVGTASGTVTITSGSGTFTKVIATNAD